MQTMRASGAVLKRLREGLGWNQEQAAARFGISRPYLAHIEAGDRQPSAAVARRMADALGIPLGDVIEGAS